MQFNSIEFLVFFLPATLFLFYVLPKRYRVTVLLLASLVFYGMTGDMALTLLVVTIAWAAGIAVIVKRKPNLPVMWLAILVPLGFLFTFKYLGFALSIIDPSGGSREMFSFILRYTLPAGISFYTFQIVSYLIDVRDGRIEMEGNPIRFAAYVALFPQLIAGPILRYHELRDQLIHISETTRLKPDVSRGVKYLSVGLAYKVFFADVLRFFQESHNLVAGGGAADALFAVLSYSFIIYFDFWAYSLMAIGLAKLFCIHLPRNFMEPYLSLSPKEFWRRWHVTLSFWLRDYVYLRLGGNVHYVRNIAIVFVAVGVWHGAGYNFIVWGAYHAALVLAYHWTRPAWDRLPQALQIAATFALVSLGWPLFYLDIGGYIDVMTVILTLQPATAAVQFGTGAWLYLGGVASWTFFTREDNWLFNERPGRVSDNPVVHGIIFSVSVIFLYFAQNFIYFNF